MTTVTREQLQSIEWVGPLRVLETDRTCVVCRRSKLEGHALDCWLAAALAAPPAEDETLESELLEVAEALGMVNWLEGQGGYQRATGAEMARAIKAQAPPAATLKSLEIGVCSSNCGPVYRADEDGCCVTCGGDITFHDRSWPLGQTRCTVCRDTALPCQLGHTGRMLGSRSVAPAPPASDPPGLEQRNKEVALLLNSLVLSAIAKGAQSQHDIPVEDRITDADLERYESKIMALSARQSDPPGPTVINEDDGDVCIDFDFANDRVVSIRLGEESCGYSALIGRVSSHGLLDKLPAPVLALLRTEAQSVRLARQSDPPGLVRRLAEVFWDLQFAPDCWCDGVNKHSDACKAARAITAEVKLAYDLTVPASPQAETMPTIQVGDMVAMSGYDHQLTAYQVETDKEAVEWMTSQYCDDILAIYRDPLWRRPTKGGE